MKRIVWTLALVAGALSACSAPVVPEADREAALAILSDLDDRTLSVEAQLANYADDAVILVPGEREHRGTEALRAHLSTVGVGVDLRTTHEIVELESFDDLVVVQGRVVGSAGPEGSDDVFRFETKNLILLERTDAGGLTISKVIYNMAPTPGE
ncbi:nuclear transport factor 2 family protein [Parvularcula sp. ZS-1/3]|uniref:Nuclear transport factor 2 family protein n=1 Tax=Parvularcula mediterranea TaxID=2732508 RepID=A0A7Y3RNB7_9PROT|nr:nuclear transport factor 2 family protein [Parvularcula mediterranea]NNU17208.1 nuclear transport factor 2 family protein [Parvularcula mediterranea]